MTSKLKCPYCSEDLESTTGGWEYGCTNVNCLSAGTLCGTEELWQALIQSQQDLEESQQATLENAQTVLEIHKDLDFVIKMLGQIAELALAHDDISIADEVVGVFDALKQQDLAYKIREQIDHIADASKMVEHKEI